MAKPLSWNTLEQAAKWLSEKTNEEWSETRIIDFAIEYCRPDYTIEDIKYPTYLRAILPDSLVGSLTWVALGLDDGSWPDYVNKDIYVDGKMKSVVFLFKENLVGLKANEKTELNFILSNDQAVKSHENLKQLDKNDPKPVLVYCELRPLFIDLDKPSQLPSIPPIFIDIRMVGIRDVDIKELLRCYLDKKSLITQEIKTQKKLKEDQTDKVMQSNANQDATVATNISVSQQPDKTPGELDGDEFCEAECLFFDPRSRDQIKVLYPAICNDDWKKFFDRADRNGLKDARDGDDKKPYKYNPAKVGNWLIRKGKYRQDSIAKILSKNLPSRSREHRDVLLERRCLLDSDN